MKIGFGLVVIDRDIDIYYMAVLTGSSSASFIIKTEKKSGTNCKLRVSVDESEWNVLAFRSSPWSYFWDNHRQPELSSTLSDRALESADPREYLLEVVGTIKYHPDLCVSILFVRWKA